MSVPYGAISWSVDVAFPNHKHFRLGGYMSNFKSHPPLNALVNPCDKLAIERMHSESKIEKEFSMIGINQAHKQT